jgi:ribose transport system substrate-binding protein
VFRSLALPTVSQEQQVAERMLATSVHPNAIVALSETSTRGTFFALIESHFVSRIRLVGFDQNVLAPIRTGEIDSVVIQNTYLMGRAAMQAISKQIAGNIGQVRFMVKPLLVTRDTIDAPDVRQSLDTDWYRP